MRLRNILYLWNEIKTKGNEKEKFKIWDDKIDNILEKNDITKEQSDLIYELKSRLSINLFKDIKSNDEKEIFKTIFLKNFLKKSINVFSEDFIYDNFYSISSNINYIAAPGEPDEGELPGCTCNRGSIWSCVGASFECKSTNKCSDTTTGCGFFTMFECNGRCFLY